MGGELLVEALIVWPIHDQENRRKQYENDGAYSAAGPRQGLQKARAFAGGVEEDGLAKHAPKWDGSLCSVPEDHQRPRQ